MKKYSMVIIEPKSERGGLEYFLLQLLRENAHYFINQIACLKKTCWVIKLNKHIGIA